MSYAERIRDVYSKMDDLIDKRIPFTAHWTNHEGEEGNDSVVLPVSENGDYLTVVMLSDGVSWAEKGTSFIVSFEDFQDINWTPARIEDDSWMQYLRDPIYPRRKDS